MNDKQLEEQLEQLSLHYRQERFPQEEKNIDEFIARGCRQNKQLRLRPWYKVAAVACIMALAVLSAVRLRPGADLNATHLDKEVLFCCNNDCSAEQTIARMDHLIH